MLIALPFIFFGGTQNVLAASCTGQASGQAGTCQSSATITTTCTGAYEVPSPNQCAVGETCCVGSPGPPPPPSGTGVCAPNMTKIAGVCVPTSQTTGLSDKPVADILLNFMKWLLAIFGVLAIIGFVISGVQYLFSAGDEQMAETAKRNMKYCIIGVIVALSGWVIIQAIDAALNASTLF